MTVISTGSTSFSGIRPFHPDDTADVHQIVSKPQVALELTFVPDSEMIETRSWLETTRLDAHRFVFESDDKVVGLASLKQPANIRLAHTGQVSILVHPDYWGKGIGKMLMGALLELADNWLLLTRLEASVLCDNERAIHLLEHFDFSIEGTRRKAVYGNGQFLDQHLMTRLDISGARAQTKSGKINQVSMDPFEPKSKIADLLIRPVQHEDIASLYEIFRHPQVARTTLQSPSQEISRTEERINKPPPGLYRKVAVVDGKPVGMISIMVNQSPRMSHNAGLGMMVHPAFWGRGIGSCLMENILDLADNWLNLSRIELDVNTDNKAGIRLYQKYGFEVEGTKRFHAFGDGRWADSYFMARLR